MIDIHPWVEGIQEERDYVENFISWFISKDVSEMFLSDYFLLLCACIFFIITRNDKFIEKIVKCVEM